MKDKLPEIAEALKRAMQALPLVTSELAGVGGMIKAEPEHFEVQEVLPYPACGEGEHVFITLRRRQWNTVDMAGELSRCFRVPKIDIGWGGRKDKQAVATQTFSVRLPLNFSLDDIRSRLAGLPFEILGLARHRNKIKTGHVAANRFRVFLSDVAPQRLAQALQIGALLQRRGLPNFFGDQRFGIDLRNIDRGLGLFARGRPARGKQEELYVSALQSAFFNLWLRERIERGEYAAVLDGDVAQKSDTGGMFVVSDAAEAAERFARRAIVYTGPIFGPKMMAAAGAAAEHENSLLNRWGLAAGAFAALKSPGSRRRALLYIDDLSIEPAPGGLLFSFTLPPGAYATNLMREFMRPPAQVFISAPK